MVWDFQSVEPKNVRSSASETRLPSRSSVSASMRLQLHWLNIDERIRFKMALLAYKSIHGLAPAYLSTYCIPVSSLPGRSHLRLAGRVAIACAEDKNCDARPSWLFLGLSQHLEHSPCSASRFRTVSRQLQAETEIPFFYILVIVLFFFNVLFHRARLRDF